MEGRREGSLNEAEQIPRSQLEGYKGIILEGGREGKGEGKHVSQMSKFK